MTDRSFRPRLSMSGVSPTGDGISDALGAAVDRNKSVRDQMSKALFTALAKGKTPTRFVLNAHAWSKVVKECVGDWKLSTDSREFMGVPVRIDNSQLKKDCLIVGLLTK